MSKGQTTIFVILGIVIIAVVLFSVFFLFKGSKVDEKIDYHEIDSDVQYFIESCMQLTANKGLKEMGETEFNNPSFEKEIIEEYLTKYIENELTNCTNNFSQFREKNYRIEEDTFEPEVVVGPKKTFLKAKYPLKLESNKETVKIETFETNIPFDYESKKNTVDELISQMSSEEELVASAENTNSEQYENRMIFQNPDIKKISTLSISKIIEQAMQEEFTFDLVYEAAGLTSLKMNYPEKGNQPTNSHAIQMQQSNIKEEDKATFYIEPIPDFTYQDEDITYQIKTSETGPVSYKEYSEYISIDKNGQLTIEGPIPYTLYEIITVTNEENKIAEQFVIIFNESTE